MHSFLHAKPLLRLSPKLHHSLRYSLSIFPENFKHIRCLDFLIARFDHFLKNYNFHGPRIITPITTKFLPQLNMCICYLPWKFCTNPLNSLWASLIWPFFQNFKFSWTPDYNPDHYQIFTTSAQVHFLPSRQIWLKSFD